MISIRKYWIEIAVMVLVVLWAISVVSQPFGLFILPASIALVAVCSFLSRKMLFLHKQGPLPWYGSPIFWVGLLCAGAVIAWNIFNT